MLRPLVSIIIPNFNKDRFIIETLNSVLNQDYLNWEIICVDDGSSDDSVSIIQEYAKKDKRIKFHKREREPKGANTCRNIGISNAVGNLIMFLDSDDLLSEKALSNRIAFQTKNKECDFTVFKMGTFYKKLGDSNNVWDLPQTNHLIKFLKHDLPWAVPSVLWKRSFMEKLKGFDEEFPRLQDVELHTRALLTEGVNYKVDVDSSPDCYYRIDEGRFVSSNEEFYRSWVKGTICYVVKMFYLLHNQQSNKLKYLKGTIVTMVAQLYQNSKVSSTLKKELINKLKTDINVKKVMGKRGFFYLWIYQKGLSINLFKIRGFNKIWKLIIVYY